MNIHTKWNLKKPHSSLCEVLLLIQIKLDLLPNDVVHAIRVLLRKQVDFRWVVSKAHGTNDAQIWF